MVPFWILISEWEFQLLDILALVSYYQYFGSSHSNRHVVISDFFFNSHFSNDIGYRAFVSFAQLASYIFIGEVRVSGLLPILKSVFF